MLDVSDIRIDYGGIAAVRGVSLYVKMGEIVTLIGANGAGKSSILAGICGLEKLSGGCVKFEGKDITGIGAARTAALGISLVPEGRRIFGKMSVLENLEMGGYTKSSLELKESLKDMLEVFPVLSERTAQHGGTLSGGEQQMLAIARGLMNRPKLLLLDEPSLGLSPIMEQIVFKIIREIRERGTTLLLVEQNANLALGVSDRAYIVGNGEITMTGKAALLLQDVNVRKSYLGG